MIRVKICGMTRPEDVRAAVAAGADALGFVFFEKSPRNVTPEEAAELLREVPPFITTVGLFVNAERETIYRVMSSCPLDLVQLHGDESPEFCASLPGRVVKALRIGGPADLENLERWPVEGLLLDAKVKGSYGGTGESFDWSLLENVKTHHPLILAGGLNPDNVAEAVRRVKPFAVDVSSGVESEPGKKDPDKINAFIQRARAAQME